MRLIFLLISPAPGQRVVHRSKNLIDGDFAIVIGIARVARVDTCVAKSNVHHPEQLVHRDELVVVAVTDTRRRR